MKLLGCWALVLTAAGSLFGAAASDVADAAMKGDKAAVRSLLQRKADVNAPQKDGTTALHWAVQSDDLETADLLIRAGAHVSAANRDGATPLLLASVNGSAAMLEKLVQAGADPNGPLTKAGDTALMMAARAGKTDALAVLLDHGAQINAKETWGDTTALMWAVSERHPAAVKLLIERGADVNARSKFVPSTTGRGFEGTTPADSKPAQPAQEFASGLLTPLMFAAREGDLESARVLVAAGADVNATGGDGKDALGLAIFNGNYDLASFLVDNHAKVNQADAQRFTPLFWQWIGATWKRPPTSPGW
jgi:ankyrin repeat protein